jgi:hypothetical protein
LEEPGGQHKLVPSKHFGDQKLRKNLADRAPVSERRSALADPIDPGRLAEANGRPVYKMGSRSSGPYTACPGPTESDTVWVEIGRSNPEPGRPTVKNAFGSPTRGRIRPWVGPDDPVEYDLG